MELTYLTLLISILIGSFGGIMSALQRRPYLLIKKEKRMLRLFVSHAFIGSLSSIIFLAFIFSSNLLMEESDIYKLLLLAFVAGYSGPRFLENTTDNLEDNVKKSTDKRGQHNG